MSCGILGVAATHGIDFYGGCFKEGPDLPSRGCGEEAAMQGWESPRPLAVASGLAWVSAGLMAALALAMVATGAPPPLQADKLVVPAVAWGLAVALGLSAWGIGHGRWRWMVLATFSALLPLLALTTVGPYLLLNVLVWAVVMINRRRLR